jgi:hypothetical protein
VPSHSLVDGRGLLVAQDRRRLLEGLFVLYPEAFREQTDEATMWTLIIFVFLGGSGGSSATVTTLQFASQDFCTSAQATIADSGNPNDVNGSFYKVFGKCVHTGAGP